LNNLSILIVHWNTSSLTLNFIECLLPFINQYGWNIFCLENDSSQIEKNKFIKGLAEKKITNNAKFHLYESEENKGFAGGINFLFKETRKKFPKNAIWVSNTDITIPAATFEFINESIDLDKEIRLVGAFVNNELGTKRLFSGASFPQTLFGIQHSNKVDLIANQYYSTAYCEGSSFIMSDYLCHQIELNREVLFDTRLFLYAEDLELGLYLTKIGYSIYLNSNFQIFHKHSQSGGGSGNALAFYYITRNRILLARWYFKKPIFFIYIFFSIFSRLILNLFLFTRRNPKLRNAIFRGICDGIGGKTGKWENHP